MNKLQLKLIFGFLRLLSLFSGCFFLFWIAWDFVVQEKAFEVVLLQDLMNILMFLFSLMAASILGLVKEDPGLLIRQKSQRPQRGKKKHEEEDEGEKLPVF